MDVFIEAAKSFNGKVIHWVCHTKNPSEISDRAKEFCKTSTNSVIITGQDSDTFFKSLARELGVGSPSAIRRPLSTMNGWIEDAAKGQIIDGDIQAELDEARAQSARIQKCADVDIMEKPKRGRAKNSVSQASSIRELRLAGKVEDALKLYQSLPSKGDYAALYEGAISAYDLGFERRDTDTLSVAIKLLDAALNDERGNKSEADRALIKNYLAIILSIYCHMNSDIHYIERAEELYKEILKFYSYEKYPNNWADIQNNLGNILGERGVRLGGEEGLASLKAAETAYGEALRVRTRQESPVEWAMIQNNLGAVFSNLAGRLDAEGGLVSLKDAEAAYRAALEVRTRKDLPVQWAMTQNNLGGVLLELGRRTKGDERLSNLTAAEAAYNAALEVYNRKDFPTEWALAHTNIAGLYEALYNHSKDKGLIIKALNAVEMSLEIFQLLKADFFISRANNIKDLLKVKFEQHEDPPIV